MPLNVASHPVPPDFVDLAVRIPDARLDIRYAGANNFIGAPVDGYAAPRALLARPAAEALALAAGDFRAASLYLWIFDAYRPARAVRHFVRWAQNASDTARKADFYPDLEKRELIPGGYIAERSGHSRGATIDLTLCDANGAPLDMGGTFDFFGGKSAYAAQGLTAAQQKNRARLRDGMGARGFVPYDCEWWHFRFEPEPYPDTYFDFPLNADESSSSVSRFVP